MAGLAKLLFNMRLAQWRVTWLIEHLPAGRQVLPRINPDSYRDGVLTVLCSDPDSHRDATAPSAKTLAFIVKPPSIQNFVIFRKNFLYGQNI